MLAQSVLLSFIYAFIRVHLIFKFSNFMNVYALYERLILYVEGMKGYGKR